MTIHMDDMGIAVVGASEDVESVRSVFDFELVEDSLSLVEVAELLVNIVCNLQVLQGLAWVSNVPKFDGQIVPGHYQLVVGRVEGCRRH